MTQTIQSPFSLGQRLLRLAWSVAWTLLCRPLPRTCFVWRRALLRLFGARIDPTSRVYGTVSIWAPWNLVMGPRTVLGAEVDCYNVAPVTLEAGAIVSQYAYLCTAGYDTRNADLPLISAPIVVRAKAWVCAKAVVGMGVTIGEGAVVALGAVVVKSVGPWTIVGGNPAREIGQRHLEEDRIA